MQSTQDGPADYPANDLDRARDRRILIAIYTGIAPRWLAAFGYGLSVLILIGSYYTSWIFIVFPLWVFLYSIYILIDNLRRPSATASQSGPNVLSG